jgi:hypothetical protein
MRGGVSQRSTSFTNRQIQTHVRFPWSGRFSEHADESEGSITAGHDDLGMLSTGITRGVNARPATGPVGYSPTIGSFKIDVDWN